MGQRRRRPGAGAADAGASALNGPRRVVISLGNASTLHDGFGEFAVQVCQRIAAQAPAWRERYGVTFAIHGRERFFGHFGNEVEYLPISRWQQWRAMDIGRCDLWHSLHQLNRTLPPRGVPTGARVLTVHDLSYRYNRNAWSTWRHGRRMNRLIGRTDVVIAISQYTANDVKRFLGWREPIQVIYNGARSVTHLPRVPLPGWTEDDPRLARPYIFHLSRLNPSKNPGSLIELARAWPEMHFVICGSVNVHSTRMAANTHLPNVEFHLGISDEQKAWAYAHCAGFIFPSLTEGFGLPPIEAMHFGKPVFLARRTSLPEIGGPQADYFDDFDPQSMKRVVQAGLLRAQAPGHADALRAHTTQFNWDVAVDAYLDVYRRLLKV